MKKENIKGFYIYGKKPVLEILKNNPKKIKNLFLIEKNKNDAFFHEIINLSKKNKIRLEYISPKTASNKIGKVNDQGIIALIDSYEYTDWLIWKENLKNNKELVIILDHIEDVGNFGAIIRTAAAADVSAIMIPNDRQAPVNGTVFKTSAGAILKIKIIKAGNLVNTINNLKELGFWIYSFDISEEKENKNLWDCNFLNEKSVFIFGSEGKGVSRILKENSDFIVNIEMNKEIESLNVSASAAIAIYEWKRQNSAN